MQRTELGALASALVLLASCGPPAPAGRTTAPESQRPPKVLTIVEQFEPKGANLAVSFSSPQGGANAHHLVHNTLSVNNQETDTYEPQLAAELPSVEKGTWRVNPNGTMDTIWTLRPSVKWHDGELFTAQDVVFAFNAYVDPEIPVARIPILNQMQVVAPDPQTVTIHWSTIYKNADRAEGLVPLPRHRLEGVLAQDKAAFAQKALLSSEFVGLGPFRLVRWEQGTLMEFTAFDDYFRGRPPLDRIILRFVPDANAMAAWALSEEADVVLPTGVDVEGALEVRRRWEGTGNRVLILPLASVVDVVPQHRLEYARPRNALPNVAVRQALYHAIDRQAVVDVTSQGTEAIADSYFAPNNPLRAQVQDAIPRYPYDPRRGQDLLAQAGWFRRSDGILIHSTSGERFEVQLRITDRPRDHRIQAVIMDNWKAVGLQVDPDVIPATLRSDREHRVTAPGAWIFAFPSEKYHPDVHSKVIPTADNRWVGTNQGGYSNPRVDGLLDRLDITIDVREATPLHRELVREEMTALPRMPLLWRSEPLLVLKSIKGPNGTSPWNVYGWDRE